MYQSKQQGRARYSFYHAELNEQLVSRVGLERELAQAVRATSCGCTTSRSSTRASGRLAGCEALLRWQHPTRGLLLPASSSAWPRSAGLVRELGAWSCDAACALSARWHAAGLEAGRVSVNVSALQFRDQRLVETSSARCSATACEPTHSSSS